MPLGDDRHGGVEADREGCPQRAFREFVDFYARVIRYGLRDKVTRIEFEHTEHQ